MNCGQTRYEKPSLRRSASQMNIGMLEKVENVVGKILKGFILKFERFLQCKLELFQSSTKTFQLQLFDL